MLPLQFASNILAQAPTWTDKEVIGTVVSVAVALASLFGIAIKFATGATRRRALKAERERQELLNELERLKTLVATSSLEDVKQQLAEARQEAEKHLKAAEGLKSSLDDVQAAVDQHQADLGTERRRIQRALNKDGQTWNEKVLSSAPDFKALDPEGRCMPVISVLNLKGGVGKTTITANLGAALDALGYRVLLIDLDLQGSLTGLYLSENEQSKLDEESHLLADFLASSFGAESPNLLDYVRAVLPDGKSALVPTTDNLAYAETNLTIRWLLREEGNRDPRFLLMKELQLKRITNQYDIVLLDCPPIINVCCVNALAASDYLLIPILPSKQATSRVPVLLKRLKEFRDNINAELKIMGILANRTQRSELTYSEENRLTALRNECKDVWGTDVPLFDTFIRQSAEIRAAEDEHRPLQPDNETFPIFEELAREVVSRLPTFCHASTSPERSAKGVTS
jgi:cellulose biosynthesis protein BcsQ